VFDDDVPAEVCVHISRHVVPHGLPGPGVVLPSSADPSSSLLLSSLELSDTKVFEP